MIDRMVIRPARGLRAFVVAAGLLLAGVGSLAAADNRPIGVFDSGTGGLTVLEKMLTDAYAHEKFVYLGDQANMPYGDYAAAGKSDFLRGLVVRDAEFLLAKDAKIIVIACNTATAYGYDAVSQLLEKRGDGTRVIGVVNAGARSVIRQLDLVRNPRPCAIGVMATPGTISSGVYERTIKAELARQGVTCEVRVFSRGCAGLADAVEAGSPAAPEIACSNMKALMAEQEAKAPHLPLRAVILGCTHFPFVQRELEALAPKGLVFVDPAVDTAAECAAALKEQDRVTAARTPTSVDVYVSVAAPGLDPSKLDAKGGLTRAWKYGRSDAAADRSTVPVPILEATKGDPLAFIPFAHMIPRVKEQLHRLFPKAEHEWDLYEGTELPMEGRSVAKGKGDVTWYDRLADGTSNDVPAAVQGLQVHTAGVCLRFKTPSDRLLIDWTPYNTENLGMWHMPSTGASGVDVYQLDPKLGWRMVQPPWPCPPRVEGARYVWTVVPNLPTYVYLPLYNGLRTLTLGVRPGSSIEPVPHASGIEKPVVVYGSSVTQGGCVSHPGLCPTSVAGRLADVPVVNLGFSGAGRMEPGLLKRLSDIDASCYVLNTVGNMDMGLLKERFEKFIRELMAKRPGVPVIVATDRYMVDADHVSRNDFLAALVNRLRSEEPEKFARLSLACDDDPELVNVENTVEGIHFSDIGAVRWGTDLGRAIRAALAAKHENR